MTDNLPYGQRGTLDYDPVDGTLLCHVCGGRYRNLAQHARLAHGLAADDYRALAGLNRQTRLITPEMRARLREVTAPTIAKLRARGKLKRWNEDPEKWRADKAAAVETLHEGLRPEGRQSQAARWTPETRAALAAKTRARNLAGELRADPAAISAGLRAHYAKHPEAVDTERLRRQAQTLKARGMPRRMFTCARCGAPFESGCSRAKILPRVPAAARAYNTAWARRKRNARGGQS
jgi:hypothetical protein